MFLKWNLWYFFLGGIELFRGFLRSEFSEENLEFWIACQEYKHCENSQMLPTQSQKIYGDFVAVQAPKEVTKTSDFCNTS